MNEARETLSGVYKFQMVQYIYYIYSPLTREISIKIAPKVGIIPEAEGYQGCNIIHIPQERVEYLFYYIGIILDS